MCQVIVTARSLLWVLLSLIAVLAIISAILTPRWLIGPSQYKLESGKKLKIKKLFYY